MYLESGLIFAALVLALIVLLSSAIWIFREYERGGAYDPLAPLKR